MSWRARPSSILLAVVFALLFVALGLGLITDQIDGGRGGRVLGISLVIGVPLAVWRTVGHCAIRLGSLALTVVNPVRTTSIPLSGIQQVRASSYGIVVAYRIEGRSRRIVAVAVQKANWSMLTGRATRSDDVVRAINIAAGTALDES